MIESDEAAVIDETEAEVAAAVEALIEKGDEARVSVETDEMGATSTTNAIADIDEAEAEAEAEVEAVMTDEIDAPAPARRVPSVTHERTKLQPARRRQQPAQRQRQQWWNHQHQPSAMPATMKPQFRARAIVMAVEETRAVATNRHPIKSRAAGLAFIQLDWIDDWIHDWIDDWIDDWIGLV